MNCLTNQAGFIYLFFYKTLPVLQASALGFQERGISCIQFKPQLVRTGWNPQDPPARAELETLPSEHADTSFLREVRW